MKKILHVAQREFIATAGTKAFIFGIFVTPLVIGVLMLFIPRMAIEDPPAITAAWTSSTRPARSPPDWRPTWSPRASRRAGGRRSSGSGKPCPPRSGRRAA